MDASTLAPAALALYARLVSASSLDDAAHRLVSALSGSRRGIGDGAHPEVGKRAGHVTRRCQNRRMQTPPSPPVQARNPLHGVTLERIVTDLVACYGWSGLGERIALRCFTSDPSIASSLKFLRKTAWARDKVEGLYLFMLREAKRSGTAPAPHASPGP